MEKPAISAFSFGTLSISNPSDWSDEIKCGSRTINLFTGNQSFYWVGFFNFLIGLQFDPSMKNDVFDPDAFYKFRRVFEDELRFHFDYESFGYQFPDISNRPENEALFNGGGRDQSSDLFRRTVIRTLSKEEYKEDFAASSDEPNFFEREAWLFESLLTAIEVPAREVRRSLESDGYVRDPFIPEIGGAAFLILGMIPYSFTVRTEKGEENYRKIEALLWNIEKKTEEEKTSLKFYFAMSSLVKVLKEFFVFYSQAKDTRRFTSDTNSTLDGVFELLAKIPGEAENKEDNNSVSERSKAHGGSNLGQAQLENVVERILQERTEK